MTRRYLVFLLPLLLAPTTGLALNEGLGEPPPEVDRHTPTASVAGFLEAAHTRDRGLMPHYLWLSHLPKEQQRTEGERLARRLMFVVDRTRWFDFSRISQDAQGDPADALYDSLGQIPTLERGWHLECASNTSPGSASCPPE